MFTKDEPLKLHKILGVANRASRFTSKYLLTQALFHKGTAWVEVTNHKGQTIVGILSTIERESGSGRSFNLKINVGTGFKFIHVYTID